MSVYTTKISRIMYASEEGYIIAKTENKMTVKGTVHHDPKELIGVSIEFVGEVVPNRQYNNNDFNFTQYMMKVSFSSFFLNKIVKVPLSVTDEIIKTYGEDLQSVIEDTPEKLLKIKGIGEKKLAKIIESYSKNKEMHELAEFLLPFGISSGRIEAIHDFFKKIKKDAIAQIKKNPYMLTRMARVGFARADEIAKKIGHKVDSPFRISQGIVHTIKNHIDENGHTYIMKDELYSKSMDVLYCEADEKIGNPLFILTEQLFIENLDLLLIEKNNQIEMIFDNAYSLPNIIKSERTIFNILKKYGENSNGPILSPERLEKYIEHREKENNFKFGENQKDAIRLSNQRQSIFFIYGLAGSGKTTVSRDALKIFSQVVSEDKIVVSSLSGVAANRAKNVTGYKGMTIHSLLGFQGKDWIYNKDNKLPYEVIMLDECSMVDSYLFSLLLEAIDFSKTTLMLVGDPAQLQSIGAGDIYANIIDSGLCKGVGLKEVFRQSKNQIINVFATEYIRQGKMLKDFDLEYKDFKYTPINITNGFQIKKNVTAAEWKVIREENNNSILREIEDVTKSHVQEIWGSIVKKDIFKYINGYQVISPQRIGILGVDNLNKVLQKIINPRTPKVKITVNDTTFMKFDKIIHLKNDNRKVCTREEYHGNKKNIIPFLDNQEGTTRVFNGQIGVVLDIVIEEDEPYAFVYFPNEGYVAMYEKSDFAKRIINLSYAMSIHKSQGSEFNVTVMPVTNSHYKMLNNQLFYTAFTRAKSKLYLIGEGFALKRGCTNIADTKRDTILSYLSNPEKGILPSSLCMDQQNTDENNLPNNGNISMP